MESTICEDYLLDELKDLRKKFGVNSIQHYVLAEIFERLDGRSTDKEIKDFFEDFEHGCASGVVSGLIEYEDTHAFFDRFYNEIEELRKDFEEEPQNFLHPGDQDLKTFFAWFAFEKVADDLVNKLEIY